MTANGGALALRTFEEICDESREAAERQDSGRWIIGDNALEVEAHYGQDTIGEYARQINVKKGRVEEYRTVCRFYKKSAREDFLSTAPNITYSHMRLAMSLDDEHSAYRFLNRCADRTWTVDKAEYVMARMRAIVGDKQRRPKKLIDAQAALVSVNVAAGCIELSLPLDQRAKLQALGKTGRGEIVRLVVYAIT